MPRRPARRGPISDILRAAGVHDSPGLGGTELIGGAADPNLIGTLMAENESSDVYVTHPPRWLKIGLVMALLAAVAITWFFVATEESSTWIRIGVLLSILFGAGVADVMTAHVALGESEVTVRNNLRTRRIPWGDVTEIKREGGRIWLRLRGETWWGMPEWCEGGIGFHNRVSAKLRRYRET